MKRSLPYLVALCLFVAALYGADQKPGTIDSLDNLLKTAVDDTVRLEVETALTEEYLSNDALNCLLHARKAVALAYKLDELWLVPYLLNYEGICFDDLGDYKEADMAYDEAIGMTHRLMADDSAFIDEYKADLVMFYNNAGYTEYNRGNLEEAMELYAESVDIGLDIGSPELVSTYASIAELLLYSGNTDEAERYASMAIELCPDSSAILSEVDIRGDLMLKRNEVENAIAFYEDMLDLPDSLLTNYDRSVAYVGLSKCYLALDTPLRALQYAQLSLASAEIVDNKAMQAVSYGLISEATFKMGDRPASESSLQQAIEIARQSGSLVYLADFYTLRARQKAASNDFQAAFNAENRASAIRDSLRMMNARTGITEFLESREAERQAEMAALLKEQLEEGKLRERNSRRFGLVMFICALLLLAISYFIVRRRGSTKLEFGLYPEHQFKEDKTRFIRRISGTVLVLLVPMMVYVVIWRDLRQVWVTLAATTIALTIYLTSRTKWNKYANYIVFLAYPLAVFVPTNVSALSAVMLWIPATYVILSYALFGAPKQILNGVLALAALMTAVYRYNMIESTGPQLQPEAQLILAVMALASIFIALYYHRGKVFDYQFGMDNVASFMRHMADTNPNFVFATDRTRKFIFANSAMSEAYGLPLKDIIGRIPEEVNEGYKESDHFRKDDIEVIEEQREVLVSEEKVYDKDGNVVWLKTVKKPFYDRKGDVVGMVGVSTDITRVRKSQLELSTSLSLLEAAINSTADGLLVVNLDREIIMHNRQFVEIWGEAAADRSLSARQRLKIVADQCTDPAQFTMRVDDIFEETTSTTHDTLHLRDGRIIERYSQAQTIDGEVVGRVWSFRDVTARESAIQDLKLSEERYRTSLEDNLFAIVRVKNGKFLSVNKAVENLTGYSAEELQTIPVDKIVHAEDLGQLDGFSRDIVSGVSKTGTVSCRVIGKDGTVRHVLASVKGYYDRLGRYVESTVTAADITPLKQAEARLAASEERYRYLVETSPDGIMVLDKNGYITFVSNRVREILGEGAESPIGKHLLDYTIPEELEEASEDLAKALSENVTAFARFWAQLPSGDRIRVELNTRLLTNSSGEPNGMLIVLRDITESWMAQRVLSESEQRYRALFENTFDGLAVLDGTGVIRDVNPSLLEFLKYPDIESLRGVTLSTIFPSIVGDEAYEKVISGKVDRTLPIRAEGTDHIGHTLFAEINFSVVPMAEGKRIACAIRDVAERVILENKERELKDQEVQLDALNREMASLSIFNSQKIKLLTEIQADLDEVRKRAGDSVQPVLARVGRKIKSNLNEQEDMTAFKIQFEKIHPNFFRNLTSVCPKLTSHDMKYCAYIRLNMSTQDISNLLFVEKKSVEMSKYRIKKKLGLQKKERLTEFLQSI